MDFISKLVVLFVANLVVDSGVHAQTAEARNCGTEYQNPIKTRIKTDDLVASPGSSEVKIKKVIAAFLVQVDKCNFLLFSSIHGWW